MMWAIEDSIFTIKKQAITYKAQRDTARNEIYVIEGIHDATKPSVFDNFIVGFGVGIVVVIGTGMVLNGTWD